MRCLSFCLSLLLALLLCPSSLALYSPPLRPWCTAGVALVTAILSTQSQSGAVQVRHVARPRVRHITSLEDRRPEAGPTVASEDARKVRPSNKAVYSWPGVVELTGPVLYHAGPVLTKPIKVHVIYYGSWNGNFGQSVINNLFMSFKTTKLNGKRIPSVREWWGIMAPYYMTARGKKAPLARQVALGKSIVVNKGFKKTLADGLDGGKSDVLQIVLTQISKRALPADPSAIYVVITSGEIRVGPTGSGFCESYCGWHNIGKSSKGTAIHYVFVGDGTRRCNAGCGHNGGRRNTPNGHRSMDSLVSTLLHEVAETASNPDTASGWYAIDVLGRNGFENADLCNGNYADPKVASLPVLDKAGKFFYNLIGVNGHRFLVQSNVDIVKQKCVMRR